MQADLVGPEIGMALEAVASICPSNIEVREEQAAFVTNAVYFTVEVGGILSVWTCDMKRLVVWKPQATVDGVLGTWLMDPKKAMSLAQTAQVIGGPMSVEVTDLGFEVVVGSAVVDVPFAKLGKAPYALHRSLPEQDHYASAVVDPSSLLIALRRFKVRKSGGNANMFALKLGARDTVGVVKKVGTEDESRFDMVVPAQQGCIQTFVHGHMMDAVTSLIVLDQTSLVVSWDSDIPIRLHPERFPNVQSYVWRAV